MNSTTGFRLCFSRGVDPVRPTLWLCGAIVLAAAGCATSQSPRWVDQPWSTTVNEKVKAARVAPEDGSFKPPGQELQEGVASNVSASGETPDSEKTVYRGQDFGSSAPGWPPQTQGGNYVPPPGTSLQTPVNNQYGAPATAPYGTQYNAFSAPQTTPPPGTQAAPQIGSPNEVPPYFQPTAPNGAVVDPYNYADIDVIVQEAQTGRMTFGAAYNSNSGLVGQFIIDERNFDIGAWPRSVEDIINGTAWRGAGQGFRLELVPGNEVQRYALSFDEPYLFNSAVSFSASGYFFDRRYFDYDEQRLGGRVALGYRLTPDLSLSVGLRMENVDIHDPRVNTSPSLNAVLGDNALYLGSVSLVNDTRDHPFMASEGSYLELSYYQGFGDFDYPRGDLDYRRYFLIYQRPDGSGRHTLSLQSRVGVSGTATPIFENYFAGGFSTLRGYDFRGASPVEGGVRVGGRFQWLNTVEYTFPITADDMFKGVLFCDFGTVEEEVTLSGDTFRVAPGFGFRVHMPVGGGGGAPLAFDFAFPVNEADTDDLQVFSFYMGVLR